MNHRVKVRFAKPVCMVVLLSLLVLPGCVGALAQLIYTIKGHNVDPEYDGLEGKRVAVVCVSDDSAYGPDTLTFTLAHAVGLRLANGLGKGSEVIAPGFVERWIDENGWNEVEFVKLGEGVEADMVVAIEVGSYSLTEGSTLFKGRCDVTATVYDIEKNGQVPFVFGPRHFAFPTDGRPSIQTTERKFEALYLSQLTNLIVNQFIVHDRLESYANDAITLR